MYTRAESEETITSLELPDVSGPATFADKKEQDADLHSDIKLLQGVLSSIGDGVVVADSNGKFKLFNPAAERILGLGATDVPPEKWAETYCLFLPDKITPVPRELQPLARALCGEQTESLDLYVRRPGSDRGNWISCNARPLQREDGTIEGGVIVLRNINARKCAEEQLEAAKQTAEAANRSKSEFLSRMSHELRTPLNSILGFAQVLQMGELSERQAECVAHVFKAGKHLLALIDEVLEISRIEAGKLALSPEPVEVEEVTGQAIDMIRPLAVAANVRISVDESRNKETYVTADRQRLQQVLLNLLSNAVKYNRENGCVDVSFGALGSGRVRITVADTGPGIPPEHQCRLFTPFERLNADHTGIQGTGLGLALSRKLVESMDGLLELQSEAGRGCTFSIELPSAEAPIDRIQREGVPVSAVARQPHAKGTVLYVEDNVSNVRLMEHLLGYRPEVQLLVAMQGRMALDLAIEHEPDLIFLDLHLPDVPGDEILLRLRNEPRTQHIPVVMVSADATPGQIRRLLEAGATDYVTKPVDVARLLSILGAHLKQEAHAGNDLTFQVR